MSSVPGSRGGLAYRAAARDLAYGGAAVVG
jgi:hypothetical protein